MDGGVGGLFDRGGDAVGWIPRGIDGQVDSGVAVLAIILRFTVWVLVILAVVWIVREILRAIQMSHAPGRRSSPAVAELDMLYARGEVNRTDYLARRADLGGLSPPVPPAA
jgi:uncharacterized membrane protein